MAYMLRIHCFRHVSFEGLGCIEDWIKENNFLLTVTKFYEEPIFPALTDIDWLIIMGGSMSVNDEEIYPWLRKEKQFILEAIHTGKVVLGICLGAQLIADVLDSKVYPGNEKEIGFLPVRFSKYAEEDNVFKLLPQEIEVFEWHGETFDLPKGAKLLASSNVCRNQAFVYNDKVIALQFHFEITKQGISDLIDNCHSEIKPGRFIQTEEEIKRNLFKTIELNVFMKCILERLDKFYQSNA